MLISPGVVCDINKKTDRRKVLIVYREMIGEAQEAENRPLVVKVAGFCCDY